jgi:hypothetical protein
MIRKQKGYWDYYLVIAIQNSDFFPVKKLNCQLLRVEQPTLGSKRKIKVVRVARQKALA